MACSVQWSGSGREEDTSPDHLHLNILHEVRHGSVQSDGSLFGLLKLDGTIAFPSDFTRSGHQTEEPSVCPDNLRVRVFGSWGR